MNGTGVAQDDTKAVRLHRLAADQRLAQAQYCLALMHEHGRAPPQDLTEIARLLKLADDHATCRPGTPSVLSPRCTLPAPGS